VLDGNDPHVRMWWIFLASLAGGITALAFMKWQTMSNKEIALTVFVGTTFSLFFVPWVATAIFKMPETELRGIAACCYIGAAGAITFLPSIFDRVRRFIKGGGAS
jgi:hypothetical protein